MSGYLVLIHHGTTQMDIEKRFHGTIDAPLHPTGVNEAVKIGQEVAKRFPVDRIVSGPTQREMQTATLVGQGRPTELDPALIGQQMGALSGQKESDQAVQQLAQGTVPGGERTNAFLDRWRKRYALYQELARQGQRIGIVTHGNNLQAVLHGFNVKSAVPGFPKGCCIIAQPGQKPKLIRL